MGRKKQAVASKKEPAPKLNLKEVPEESEGLPAGGQGLIAEPKALKSFEVETAEKGYEIVEIRDTEQIIAEIEGEVAEELVYSFKTEDGRQVAGLTFKGVNEVCRIMKAIDRPVLYCRPAVWFDEEGFEALARAVDKATGNASSCIFFQPRWLKKRDGSTIIQRLSYVIAQSKAKRNAAKDIIPLVLRKSLVKAALETKKGFDPYKVLAQRREMIIEARLQKALTSERYLKGAIAKKILASWSVQYKEACKSGQIKPVREKAEKAFNRFLMEGWAVDRAKGGSTKDLEVGDLEDILLIVKKGEVDFLSGKVLPGVLPEEPKPEETG